MDDDAILDPEKNKTPGETDQPQNGGADSAEPVESTAPEHVFDISEDLNISPVNVNVDEPYKATGNPAPQANTTTIRDLPRKMPPITGDMQQANTTKSDLMSLADSLTGNKSESENISAAKKDPKLNVIRTYEGDIVNAMTRKGTSTIDMVMAEKKRETGEEKTIGTVEKEPGSWKKTLLAFTSLVLIGVGLVGAYYLYSISPLVPATNVVQQIKTVSLIPSNQVTTVAIDNLDSIQILRALKNKISVTQPPGTIEEIIPYTTAEKGIKNRTSAQQMISTMKIPAPNVLERSLMSPWMLGVYTNKNNEPSTFVVVTSNFFQNTFAGMLSWESVMSDDLKQYLYSPSLMGISNGPTATSTNDTQYFDTLNNMRMILGGQMATAISSTSTVGTTTASTSITTSSSTPEKEQLVEPYFTLRGQFQDKIVKNKDVREFVTANGNVLFLYSFIDNSRLVVAQNEETLTEIITRLEKQAFVR